MYEVMYTQGDTCHAVKQIQEQKLTSRATKARIGDKSIVPLSGGMMPLNRFKYGSHRVLQAVTIQSGP